MTLETGATGIAWAPVPATESSKADSPIAITVLLMTCLLG